MGRSICRKCSQPIATKEVTCAGCVSHFHPGCAKAFIANKPSTNCCVISFKTSPEILNSTEPSLVPTMTQSAVFKGLTPSTFNNSNASSPTSNSTVNSSPFAQSTHQVPPSAATSFLPSNWSNLNTNDQLGLIMSTLGQFRAESASEIAALRHETTAKFTAMSEQLKIVNDEVTNQAATIAVHNSNFEKIQEVTNCFRAEIHNLKTDRPQSDNSNKFNPTSELVVSGIPSDIDLTLDEITTKILHRLDLDRMSHHVLSSRPFLQNQIRHLNGEPSSVSTFSYIIKLSSTDVRDHIIDVKRQSGQFTAVDLFQAGPVVIVYMNEFLSAPQYNLLRRTREFARQRNYDRVWVRFSTIYLRKSRDSPNLTINSELDLTTLP